MKTMLLIDDEPVIHDLFAELAKDLRLEFSGAPSLAKGLGAATEKAFDMIFLDVLLPDGNGLEALQQLKATSGHPEIVVITGHGDSQGARQALLTGGWKYLQKPLGYDDIRTAIEQILDFRKFSPEKQDISTARHEGILGTSPAIKQCIRTMAEAAPRDVNVLFTGETGTGKELFARAVHDNSLRTSGPYVVLDCASLTPNLIASHLFGHVRGAFTGADQTREGLIAQAHHGTLFLDEVGELPKEIQSTFLRTLETGRYRPVGGKTERRSDFRLVAATNRNLDLLVDQGEFRSDLLYRLRTVSIILPPLRHRGDDITTLCAHYSTLLCREFNIPPKHLSKDILDTLTRYQWPGNVRELVHAMEQALSAAGQNPELYACHLPLHIRTAVTVQDVCPQPGQKIQPGQTAPHCLSIPPADEPMPTLRTFREHADRIYVEEMLKRTQGVMTRAAKEAGVSRGYLYELVKKLGLNI